MAEAGECEYCRRLGERVAAVESEVKVRESARERERIDLDRRFTEVNEFREALADLSKLMLPRAEYSSEKNALTVRLDAEARRIDDIGSRLDRIEGSTAGFIKLAGWLAIAVALIASVLGYLKI